MAEAASSSGDYITLELDFPGERPSYHRREEVLLNNHSCLS